MSWTKNLFIILIASLFTIKIVDYCFGLIIKSPDLEKLHFGDRGIILREWAPGQSLLLTPNDNYMNYTDGLVQKPYDISIDNDGFIESGNSKIEKNDFLAVFIGGSTTETLYVDEDERFPSIVERKLREEFSPHFQTINAGVSGNNSFHSLLNFQAKILPKNPKYVILMHNFNDFALLSKTGSYWFAPETKNIIQIFNSDSSLKMSVIKPNYIFRQLKNFFIPNLYEYLKPRLLSRLNTSDEFRDYREINIGKYSNEIVPMFDKSLRSFVKLSKIWGVKPILMTQFNRVSIDDPLFKKWIDSKGYRNQAQKFVDLYNSFNVVVRKVANDTNTYLIDLEAQVPKTSTYIYDIVHLNNTGSRLVGNIISRELLEILKN